jgi:ribosomal protein L11 methyltransferase
MSIINYQLSINMNYLQFDFETDTPEEADQLIALLSEQGFEGFEETENFLKAFIPEAIFSEEAFELVKDMLPTFRYTRSTVENINWNEKWERDFEPVIVDNWVAIRAHFHQPIFNVRHEIIITPKMSFGTGHHATTYLMVQQMESIDFREKTAIDFGTGTGVLAILAEMVGATKVLAIDNDEWSINNAKENVELNHCTKIIVELQDAMPATEKYNIILANINLNVILANLTAISSASKTGTKILLSGFLKQDETAIKFGLAQHGLKYVSTFQRGEWIMIIAEA